MTSKDRMPAGIPAVLVRLAFAVYLACAGPGAVSPAFADGCFVFKWNKAIDINEPTQKAIIVFDSGREDLLLQVKYEGPLEEFGWLIPVPSLPTVEKGSMEPFYELSELTQRQFGNGMTTRGPATAGLAGSAEARVKVVEIKTVGAYEVAILSAQDSGSLSGWLREHDFSLPEGRSHIIDEYIRKGWYFVAAKIQLNEGVAFRTVTVAAPKDSPPPRAAVRKALSSGELHPLLISFDSPKCIFPLKISATHGKPSEVSLYVLAAEPLLEKFTFGKACEKLARSYAEWDQQRVGARAKAMQNSRQIGLAAMMYAERNRDRSPGSPGRPRKWSNEDLEALAKESVSKFPEENLYDTFWGMPGELLQQMHLESGKIPKCTKAIARLRSKDWNLTKVVWTFSSAEMQDLEFIPAIPALAPVMSEEHGVVAARLLAQFGDDAMPALLAACKDTNATQRLNALCTLESSSKPVPADLLLALLKDASPRVRLRAARCAYSSRDQRLTQPMIELLRDPHLEIRQAASGCLVSRENTNRTSFYFGLLNDPDPNVRAEALGVAFTLRARALGIAPAVRGIASSDEVFRAALRMLRDPNADVQRTAVVLLLKNGQPVPKSDLLPLLNHPDPDTVAFVANLLRGGGRIRYVGDTAESPVPATSADLAPLMTNRFGNVRLIGLRAMQDIGDQTAVQLTLPLLRETNSVIRSCAFSTLQAITGKDVSDDDPAKWEAWWAANKASFKPRATTR